eukprot:jgi/Psemu1/26434/gm1.26434_g
MQQGNFNYSALSYPTILDDIGRDQQHNLVRRGEEIPPLRSNQLPRNACDNNIRKTLKERKKGANNTNGEMLGNKGDEVVAKKPAPVTITPNQDKPQRASGPYCNFPHIHFDWCRLHINCYKCKMRIHGPRCASSHKPSGGFMQSEARPNNGDDDHDPEEAPFATHILSESSSSESQGNNNALGKEESKYDTDAYVCHFAHSSGGDSDNEEDKDKDDNDHDDDDEEVLPPANQAKDNDNNDNNDNNNDGNDGDDDDDDDDYDDEDLLLINKVKDNDDNNNNNDDDDDDDNQKGKLPSAKGRTKSSSIAATTGTTTKKGKGRARRPTGAAPPSTYDIKDYTTLRKMGVVLKHVEELQDDSTWSSTIDCQRNPELQHFLLTYDEAVKNPKTSNNGCLQRKQPISHFFVPKDFDKNILICQYIQEGSIPSSISSACCSVPGC